MHNKKLGLRCWHAGKKLPVEHPSTTKTSCDRMDPIRKTSGFAYGPLINPAPSLSKISYKYNSMLTYIPVSFLFSFILGFGLGLKIGLGLGWVLGLRLGFGNLIGGAAGTVDPYGRNTPVPPQAKWRRAHQALPLHRQCPAEEWTSAGHCRRRFDCVRIASVVIVFDTDSVITLRAS